MPRVPLELGVAPDLMRDNAQAVDFVGSLSQIHGQVHDKLQVSSAKYKEASDRHRCELQFKFRDHVWAIMTKECSPGTYIKLQAQTIVSLDILEKITANAYESLYRRIFVAQASLMSITCLLAFRVMMLHIWG